MGDTFDNSAGQGPYGHDFNDMKQSQQNPQAQMPFHSQLNYKLAAFNMNSLGGALPSASPQSPNSPFMLSPASVYQMQHAAQYSVGRSSQPVHTGMRISAPQYDPQQYAHFGQMGQMPMGQRQGTAQSQVQFQGMDPYGYGMSAPQYSPVDLRFPGGYTMGMPPGSDYAQASQRPPDPAPVPAYPRGPPRKPKQSGHALWVGNLPPAAAITDLKDHFSRDATKDIESLFLIAKSNCAFVNYRTEAACIAAMNRFHDSRFHGIRLVCRLRRGSGTGSTTETAETPSAKPIETPTVGLPDGDSPIIVGQPPSEQVAEPAATEIIAPAHGSKDQKVPEKYFIVKSLTVQDLEASVRNGIWATQSHNERTLDTAYETADNVYLIFSANKSGEYFGYAKMTSAISGEPVKIESAAAEQHEASTTGTPRSILTPPTDTAPKGRIIDDSARGTIFWEAEASEDESGSPTNGCSDAGDGSQWGRQFNIEWVSTARLPFFRTRGLRNSWNANREVKIARDGTDLEPSVGRRLVAMFHRPSPQAQSVPIMGPPVGMHPYH